MPGTMEECNMSVKWRCCANVNTTLVFSTMIAVLCIYTIGNPSFRRVFHWPNRLPYNMVKINIFTWTWWYVEWGLPVPMSVATANYNYHSDSWLAPLAPTTATSHAAQRYDSQLTQRFSLFCRCNTYIFRLMFCRSDLNASSTWFLAEKENKVWRRLGILSPGSLAYASGSRWSSHLWRPPPETSY